ncbi:DUF2937 family protein [Microvirga sp. 0TCS3.31]
MSRIVRIIAFGLGLLGGVTASQGPEFAQQYRQRLGGAVDELRQVVQRFDTDAQVSSETRESAIARLRSNSDDFVARQGAAMEANVERLGRLEAHRTAMMESGPFSRVALIIRDGDTDIMEAVSRDFEPALPVTAEGVLSAAAGFIVIWGSLLLFSGFLRSLFRRPRRQREPVRT